MKEVDLKNPPSFKSAYIYPIAILIVILPSLTYLFIKEYKENEAKLVERIENREAQFLPKQKEVPKDAEEEDVVIEYTEYDEEPYDADSHYFEKTPEIEGQQAYIAFPLKHEKENPPTLVVYSHGSNTLVTTNFDDQFMQDMRMYGEYFTKNGYAFAASNEHGANWGSQLALDDMQNMIDWTNERYETEEKVNLLGFSMGGLPTLYYTFEDPTRVNKVALLAPTTYVWGQDKYDQLKGIPVKVWHGDQDVNIGWSVSKGFVDRGLVYGIDIPLETIQSATHFDIDTELKEKVLDFYNE